MQALTLKALRKTYNNGFEALKGIDLTVEAGDFFALLGPNGAGKSTSIGIISSLVNKTSGSVHIFGHDLDHDTMAAKSCIGLVPQEFNFNVFEPVEEIIINQAGYYGIPRPLAKQRTEKYLKQLDLWDKRRSMARELSGGMKRRLMIARALVHNPKLLILDEPTAGVDIEIRRSMWEFLAEINAAGTTIILTTHYLEEAENMCRNIAIIDQGVIVEHSSMSVLLEKLQTETLVMHLRKPLEAVPDVLLPRGNLRLTTPKTLEIEVPKDCILNHLFAALSDKNIEVLSMRNKQNRLEQLFIELVDSNRQAA
jgi:ABC-2 type transport system ATP-binding protein